MNAVLGLVGAVILRVQIAHQVQLDSAARARTGIIKVIHNVARENMEAAAEEGERTDGHPGHLEPEQLRITQGEGAVVVLEQGERVAHGNPAHPKLSLWIRTA